MTLLRRVIKQAGARVKNIDITTFVEAATVQFDTKSLQLESLAFNSSKTCLIELLSQGYFKHTQTTTIFTQRGCNCFYMADPTFPVPDGRVALLNTDE